MFEFLANKMFIDGSFDIIQCNQNYCWCSTPEGTEIEGTRVSNAIKPVCDCKLQEDDHSSGIEFLL